MPVISNLTAANSSFVLQHGNYFDFNVWGLLVAASFILLIISAYIFSKKDESGGILLGIFAFILAVASIYASLSVAHFGSIDGASQIVSNNTTNQSVVYHYIYPAQNTATSPLLTGLCILLGVFTVLNCLNMLIMILEQPKIPIRREDDFSVDGRRIKL